VPIRKIQKRRLPDVVAEQIASAVMNGEFAAGARLPPERELAERFGVSRNVVREAVNELRSRGLLETRHGSGSVVSGRLHKPVSDVLGSMVGATQDGEYKLLELRCALEINVARLAAERAGKDDMDALGRILDAYDAAGDDLDACADLDIEFHRALVRAARNELFEVVLASLEELVLRTRKASLKRSGAAVASASHRKIFKAVKRRDAQMAANAMGEHLEMTREQLWKSGGSPG
jgi:DNA-binding FadR family transcriptional regulator